MIDWSDPMWTHFTHGAASKHSNSFKATKKRWQFRMVVIVHKLKFVHYWFNLENTSCRERLDYCSWLWCLLVHVNVCVSEHCRHTTNTKGHGSKRLNRQNGRGNNWWSPIVLWCFMAQWKRMRGPLEWSDQPTVWSRGQCDGGGGGDG